ncbi:hypothetical protein BDZ91DRAFT_744095 [Kalaharituber pfeilii]|nr:hypothetical protein BDZ91DRAFT_744095 [Kalaharituber pfeilii]
MHLSAACANILIPTAKFCATFTPNCASVTPFSRRLSALQPHYYSHKLSRFGTRTVGNSSFLPPAFLRRKKKRTIVMPNRTVDDILTVRELYQDRVLAPTPPNECQAEPCQQLNGKVGLIQINIVSLEIDAIVNAANRSLLGGGGVDGVIHRAAGPDLYEECRTLGGCETGDAKVTRSYRLPCQIIIHAVGPMAWDHTSEERRVLLASCYRRSLELLVSENLRTIAFPCISTGIYGYPPNEAAEIASSTVRQFLESEDGNKIDKVAFVMFEAKDWNAYRHALPKFFPPTEDDLAGPDDSDEEGEHDTDSELEEEGKHGTDSEGDDDGYENSQPPV